MVWSSVKRKVKPSGSSFVLDKCAGLFPYMYNIMNNDMAFEFFLNETFLLILTPLVLFCY